MMIKLIEDNTVICSDGANINSGHPDKTSCAKGSLIAEAFPYRHDIIYTRTDDVIEEISFSGSGVTVNCDDCTVTEQADSNIRLVDRVKREPRSIDPLEDYSTESDRVKTFCGIVFDDEARAAFIASLPTVDDPVMAMRQVTVDLPVLEDYEHVIPAVMHEVPAVLIGVWDSNQEKIEGAFEVEQEAYMEVVEPERTEVRQRQVKEIVLVDVEESTVMDGAVQKVIAAHQVEQEQGVTVTTGVVDQDGAKVLEEYDTGEIVTLIQYKGELYEIDWNGEL